jgi:hypothetical protein
MTGDARPATRLLGSLRSANGTGVVRIEDRNDTEIDNLWSAITDPGRVARWYGRVDGDLDPRREPRRLSRGARARRHRGAVGPASPCLSGPCGQHWPAGESGVP